ncbi:MAG: HpcH/HpaI aldolase family protein [Candidatus Hinthialibacter sp.]
MREQAKNKVLEKLRNDEVVLSCSLTPVCSAKVAELIGLIGFDCLWIDQEHQDFEDENVFHACLACRAVGMAPMVRIRRQGRHSCARGFETGAAGIMVPHCMSADDARAIVRDARFYPIGLRGLDGVEASAQYGLIPTPDYMRWANQETFVVVQIEDREAVEEIDAIAEVEGIDILFVGPGDLSQSYGCPGRFNHPDIVSAYQKTAEAAARHQKYWGAPGGSPENAKRLIDMGARLINAGSLSGVMRQGFTQLHKNFRDILR